MPTVMVIFVQSTYVLVTFVHIRIPQLLPTQFWPNFKWRSPQKIWLLYFHNQIILPKIFVTKFVRLKKILDPKCKMQMILTNIGLFQVCGFVLIFDDRQGYIFQSSRVVYFEEVGMGVYFWEIDRSVCFLVKEKRWIKR